MAKKVQGFEVDGETGAADTVRAKLTAIEAEADLDSLD